MPNGLNQLAPEGGKIGNIRSGQQSFGYKEQEPEICYRYRKEG